MRVWYPVSKKVRREHSKKIIQSSGSLATGFNRQPIE